eukprot:jgi/Undpi1/934/HiC_scaffold_10.g04398.m1
MESPGERERDDSTDRVAGRVVGTIGKGGGRRDDASGSVDGQINDEWGAPGGERDGDDDIDRVARRGVGMVGEGGVEGEMMQPPLSTAEETMNGEPRGARAWR